MAAVRWGDFRSATTFHRLLQAANRPNTYTYTKALAESLVASEHGDVPVAIIRPSIGKSGDCELELQIIRFIMMINQRSISYRYYDMCYMRYLTGFSTPVQCGRNGLSAFRKPE